MRREKLAQRSVMMITVLPSAEPTWLARQLAKKH